MLFNIRFKEEDIQILFLRTEVDRSNGSNYIQDSGIQEMWLSGRSASVLLSLKNPAGSHNHV